MSHYYHSIRAFLRDEDGATAIEYGLIAALIAVAIIAAVGAVGGELRTTFEDIEAGLTEAGEGEGGGDDS